MSNPFLPPSPSRPRTVKWVDLHMHSPVSDGFWTTETLPPAARALGIQALALTDHDDVTGVAGMLAACRPYGITVIPSVEISTFFQTVGYHMLAYGIDVSNTALRAKFNQGRSYYNEMCHVAIDELARRGQPLDPAKSPQILGDAVKIYHLVAALIENGYAPNMSQAYGLINQAGAHYSWHLPMEEAIALVHGAGGVAVIAHPGRAEPGFTAATEAALDGMRAAGLDGIECFHPYHTAANVIFYKSYAQHHGLLISCGSDTHGPGQSPRMLTAWPAADCRTLLERCGLVVA